MLLRLRPLMLQQAVRGFRLQANRAELVLTLVVIFTVHRVRQRKAKLSRSHLLCRVLATRGVLPIRGVVAVVMGLELSVTTMSEIRIWLNEDLEKEILQMVTQVTLRIMVMVAARCVVRRLLLLSFSRRR